MSPRYRNETVPGVGQERFLSGELGYRLDAGSVSLTLSLYGTLCSDGTQVRRYYDDLASVYSDMMLSEIGTALRRGGTRRRLGSLRGWRSVWLRPSRGRLS